jgi:hypothetical protein
MTSASTGIVHRPGLEGVSSRVNLMNMRARRAPVIKFFVDGFRSIFGSDFDAPRR